MIQKWQRLFIAIWNREPRGHISDLWMEATGRAVLCGDPPYQHLMLKKYMGSNRMIRCASGTKYVADGE